jgi:ABC-type branched-subunit amino acid transport system permease subunit
VQSYTFFNYMLCLLIGCVLALTVVSGWKRHLLLVPTLWLAAFVWETRLVEDAPGPTRFLLLGVILVVVMSARPQGLLGRPRVEIV